MFAVTFQSRYQHDMHSVIPEVTHRSYLLVETAKEDRARRLLEVAIGSDWAFLYPWDKDFKKQIRTYELERLPYIISPTSCSCGHNWAWLRERDTGALEMLGCIKCISLKRTMELRSYRL